MQKSVKYTKISVTPKISKKMGGFGKQKYEPHIYLNSRTLLAYRDRCHVKVQLSVTHITGNTCPIL